MRLGLQNVTPGLAKRHTWACKTSLQGLQNVTPGDSLFMSFFYPVRDSLFLSFKKYLCVRARRSS
jgi:hypothetical protein